MRDRTRMKRVHPHIFKYKSLENGVPSPSDLALPKAGFNAAFEEMIAAYRAAGEP